MSSHVELNPDDSTLGLSLGMKAMRLALAQKTHKMGTVRIPTQGDTDVIIGDGAQDGANRIDQDGNQLPLVSTSGIDKAAKDAQQKADAAAAKADQVRSDLQAEVDKVRADVADVDAKAERAKTSAETAASKADLNKAELDKSVAALDKRVSDASGKGDKMAGQIADITGTVNGQQTKLNEFGTKLEGAITKNDTTVKSVTELKQTVTGLSSTVSQTTKTASDALSKATSVEQTANGLKATISKDYQTTKQADGKYSTKTELSATSESLSSSISSVKKTADGAVTSANTAQATADGVKVALSRDYTSTKNADLKYSTKAELSATSESLSSSISSVRGTADGAVVAASKARQTADAVTLNLSKNYQTKAQNDALYATQTSLKATSDSLSANITANAKTAQGAVDKATSLEANLNGFKTTVSQTYTPLSDLDALRKSATRMFTLYGASGKAQWVKLGYLTSRTDSSSILLHVYSGDGYNGYASQNAEFEIFVKDGWQNQPSASGAFGVSVNRIRDADDVKVKVMAFSSTTCDIWAYLPWNYWNGHYTLQGDYKSWQDGPDCGGTRVQDNEPTNGTAQNLAYDTVSTRSYVDQTSKSVALGVVQNYRGADGSGLATKSDITVAKKSITSTVAGTYATKSGVTQEISSKVSQNNESLDVKFATKVEIKNAQSAANMAQSNASDAQSRVGTLEDCISLTSAGVRAGHQSNGVFNGVSALVNTDGSFDLLDKDGNLLTRIDRHSFQVAGDDGVGSGHLILSQDGLDITVQPTANKKATYHIQLGAGGISITAPDGAHVECSARTGLDLETVKYGKLSIGSGGLQFTNDRGWGLALSAAGWSLKWAGNHTLATGPTAGALYIDGHEIVTR